MTTDFLSYSKWPKVMMEEGNAKCQENVRYSFLLGSALRTEDTEKFLQVYDAIVPKDLPLEQVEAIKERAREIADLPADQFDVLVKLNSYPSPSTSYGASMTSATCGENQTHTKIMADDEDMPRPGLQALSRTSRHFSVKTGLESMDGEDNDEHSDSEVFNSSKTTVGSVSDDSMSEDRGAFDYYPSKPSRCISGTKEFRRKNDAAYDFAQEVESESEESPCNDNDGELVSVVIDPISKNDTFSRPPHTIHEIEMDTFSLRSGPCAYDEESFLKSVQNQSIRQKNDMQYDEAMVVDDDDEDESVRCPLLHCGSHSAVRPYYASMDREDNEDYEAELPQGSRFSYRRLQMCPVQESRTRTSQGVHIEKVVSQRGVSTASPSRPPFGDPVNLEEVSRAAEKLLDFGHQGSHQVSNMPLGTPIIKHITPNMTDKSKDDEGNNTNATSKKKKKKKKNSKDDDGRESEGTQSSKEASYDVNGNPVEAGTHNNKLTSSINTKYCSSSTTSTANHKNRFSGEGAHNASGFPKRLDSFNKFDHNGVPVSELEDMPAGSTTADVSSRSGRKSWRRAQKEREEARKYPAKNIPGNRGNDKIEDLVSFVENTEEKKGTGGTQNGSLVGSYQNQVSQLNVEVISTKNLKKTKPILNRSKGCTALKDMKEKGGGSEDSSERGEDSGSGKASECGDLREVVASEQSQLLTDTKSKLPSTKMEADSMALLTNHAMDLHTTAVTDAASTNMLPVFENDTFIFTDFDSVSQATEEEFKVVKRKKTPRPQAPFYYQDNYQYDYQAYSGPSEVVSCREEYVPCEDRGPRRSRPMVRSVTPPPTSTKPEKDYYYQEKPSTERAFSPSAFPALGGMSLPREGRRNSTGNAPSETSPDDSDMESVKSLPLAGGASGAKADGTVSPQGISPVVSYAKIAAAPKSSKAASVVQSVSANLVLKPASSSNDCCRRHSLPSLIDPPLAGDSEAVSTEIAADVVTPKVQVNSRPVDLTLENNESSNDSLETRPEHIYNDPSCVNNRQVVDKPKAVSQTDDISNAGVNSLGSSKVVGIALTDKGTSPVTRGNCEDSVSKCVAQPPSGCPKTTSSSSSNSTGVVSKASAGASLSEASASSTVKSSPATNQWSSSPLTSKSAILSSSVSQAQPSQPQQHHQNQQQQQQQQQQTQKSTNNKKQKNKSVVFLDRRSDQPALNLGISFGFDTKLESAGPVCEQLTAPSTMAREGGPTTVSLPSDLGISKPAGGPRPGLNGLVIPSCPAVLVSAENSFTIESTLTQTEASVDDVKGTGDQPTTAPVNLVLANPAPVNTETNGPTQANTTASADPPKGLAGPTTNNKKRILNTLNLVPLKPSEDPNFHRGKFVVEDAAMFMKKEWDRIMDVKDKNPTKVFFYSSK